MWFVVVSKIIIIIIIIKVTTGHSVRNKNHNMEEIKRTGVRFRYDRVDEKYYDMKYELQTPGAKRSNLSRTPLTDVG